MKIEQRTTKIRGLQTAYLACELPHNPDGPLVFFIHGFPDTPWVWHKLFAQFAREDCELAPSQLVAPWARGVGDSEMGEGRRASPPSVLLDHLTLLDLVDASGERPVVIIGHDIGSVYAWKLAEALGERTLSLVILNGARDDQMWERWWRRPGQLLRSWYIGAFQVPWLPNKIFQRYSAPLVDWAHTKGGLPLEELDGHPLRLSGRELESGMEHYRLALREFFRERLLGGSSEKPLSRPVLAISGSHDPFVLPTSSAELARYAQRGEARTLPGGHWIQLEGPDRVGRMIDKFVVARAGS